MLQGRKVPRWALLLIALMLTTATFAVAESGPGSDGDGGDDHDELQDAGDSSGPGSGDDDGPDDDLGEDHDEAEDHDEEDAADDEDELDDADELDEDELAALRARLATGHAAAGAGNGSHNASDPPPTRARPSYTLTVLVTEPSSHGPEPADDAKVTVYALERDASRASAEPVARGQPGEAGFVRFELPPGMYAVHARDDGDNGLARVQLNEDRRVHIHVTDDRDRPGDDRRHQPGPYNLGLAVYTRGPDGPERVANASVLIERYVRGNASGDATANAASTDGLHLEPVERGVTDERGLYTTVLPGGAYKVTVTDGNLTAQKRFKLDHDAWKRIGLTDQDDPDDRERPRIQAAGPAKARAFGLRLFDDDGEDDRPIRIDRETAQRLEIRHRLWIRMKG